VASKGKKTAAQGPKKGAPTYMQPHDITLSPSVQSAAATLAFSNFAGEVDFQELVVGLRDRIRKINSGDMVSVEAMLYGQALTLQTIFTELTRRAANQDHMSQFQTYLTLALKAQSQCRTTLEALAEIKNPRPVAFVKQANIANGPQQVNNGTGTPAARAEENSASQNGLLEAQHGQWLDTGTTGTTGSADSHLEAVEAGHGTAHRKRQGDGFP